MTGCVRGNGCYKHVITWRRYGKREEGYLRSHRLLGRGDGQQQLKFRALARTTLDREVTAMRVENLAGNRQTHAGTDYLMSIVRAALEFFKDLRLLAR